MFNFLSSTVVVAYCRDHHFDQYFAHLRAVTNITELLWNVTLSYSIQP